ncbi:alpha/beta fold hydrolase [Chitinophaga sp. Cy-1792]|uniref:alpha/beta fold hydrolase n=1 Tax=Chitinophaga sp. Cy-1792 TaxID=2608339 RepID=UPI0014200400|nr:alpha/beta hydrolase [Chitinophaga sp. Cy-1792]
MRNLFLLIGCCLLFNTARSQQVNYYDTLRINGIKQVIAVNGLRDGPVLLFLHGGPGESRIPQSDKVSSLLRAQFCVIMWDQRETGLTRKLNASPVPVSIQLVNEDTYELAKLLRKKFHQDKIYVMGESWGTLPGFELAKNHPEMVKALLQVCPVVDQMTSERIAIDTLKKHAIATNNKQELKELNSVVIPFRHAADLYYSRKWMNEYWGMPFKDKDTAMIKTYLEKWCDTWLKPWNDATGQSLLATTSQLRCPVYFFLGRKDLQTNAYLSELYFNQLKSPEKRIFWFENAGHLLMLTDAEAIQQTILQQILPALKK